MRWVTFADSRGKRIGGPDAARRLRGLAAVLPALRRTMLERIAGGIPPDAAAPIPRPPKNVFCAAKNDHDHAETFAGFGFDGGAKDAALGHGFGDTIVNDVTARHRQNGQGQRMPGKGLDSFCPLGPAILTADEVPDPRALTRGTFGNSERRQHAAVADLISDIPTRIAAIRAAITLEPGDVIATGTPMGVGIGFVPPAFLKPGDVVRIEVPGRGALEKTLA